VIALYAKATPDDLCVRVHVRNAGPEAATLDVLPTLWFRNHRSWDPAVARSEIRPDAGGPVAEDALLGRMTLTAAVRPSRCRRALVTLSQRAPGRGWRRA
jgi:hypothetical protein